ncbi:MAG: DUF1232 domain-containing protein [Geminocystis sp.]|nr:DUF1232 domain-containing protein [Geminocystis sp.]HIK38133.1 DUF1232 domain-containing protein [Geminocystis sp. M7585_C2015_104]MCS7147398.1 DUF1232 domain-containing protein [Geminocystis sp.]MCX8079366.1 DUF1232 domain-containing protein [Geminocystis sp.]MDW8117087.1 DUF1232 domain-containing protein [Geminocystis sp.]
MRINPLAIYNLYGGLLRNPRWRHWVILATLIYILCPLDISPDILPLAGQLDDFVLLSMLIAEMSQMIFRGNSTQPIEEKKQEKTIDVDAVSID